MPTTIGLLLLRRRLLVAMTFLSVVAVANAQPEPASAEKSAPAASSGALVQARENPSQPANAPNPQLEVASRALGWGWTLEIFIVAGLCGGALATLRHYDSAALFKEAGERWKNTDESKSKQAIWYYVAAWSVSALGGIGGSLAALFFLVITNQIVPRSSELYFFSWGFVAGFIGLQLLTFAADTLTKRIEELAAKKATEAATREVESLRKKIDENQREIAIRAGMSIVKQKQLRAHPTPEDIDDARNRLKSEFEADKANRRLVIVYANVLGYVEEKWNEAVRILHEGVHAIPATSPTKRVDTAAMLYNMAFYSWKLGAAEADQAKQRSIQTEAIREFLKRACELDDSLKAQARADDDWAPLYTDGDFIAATA